jgi:hypothetical protein
VEVSAAELVVLEKCRHGVVVVPVEVPAARALRGGRVMRGRLRAGERGPCPRRCGVRAKGQARHVVMIAGPDQADALGGQLPKASEAPL